MTEKRSWFRRPLTALCILAGVTILSLYVIFNSGGRRDGGDEIAYRITLRHYGIDANEMEKTAAIPLEDTLSAIPGINRIMTVSENGQVRAYITFRRSRGRFAAAENEYYDAVREAAQRVYETLPSSAQRPELNFSGDFRVPFWTAAVYGSSGGEELPDGMFPDGTLPDGALLERTIKPALSSIEGVGEVEIAGPGIREIVIALDQERTAALGLSPAGISASLGSNDALFMAGTLRYSGLEIPLRVDGRYSDLDALGEALIPLGSPELPSGGAVRLKAIADIREVEREAETLSRLNGKRTAVISVTAASGAEPGILSRKIKKEMEKFDSLPLEFRVLEDRGAEESAAFRSVLIAALEASVLVALAIVLLGRGKSAGFRNAFICAAAIPLISVISAALISAAGFPVNRKFLAGLAVGIGGAVDAVILSTEGFGRGSRDGKTIMRGIWSPLVSGAATTVAALIPLAEITATGDTAVIAGALGTVTLVSVILALTLLPPLFLWARDTSLGAFSAVSPEIHCNFHAGLGALTLTQAVLKKFRRRFFRFFGNVIRFCMNHSLVFPALSLFISAAAILALAVVGADTAGTAPEDSVYAQVEFEGGFLKTEGDQLLASWAADIKKHPAVLNVQSGARIGSGYGLVTFDSGASNVDAIGDFIRSKTIPGAFIYIAEASPGDRIWTITISGDDADKCREMARKAASLCSAERGPGLSFVKETVLNFKQGGPRLTLFPRRDLLARSGVSFSFPADTVRRGLHGPVAYKRNGGGGETDVRLRFSPMGTSIALNGDDVLRIPLAAYNTTFSGSMRVGSLTEAVNTLEVSGIQRGNRRRIASFSIRTGPGDPRFFREKTMEVLDAMELPPGYRIEFDAEAIRQAEALSGKFLNFIWAVLFCYMIIAAAEESFVLPLIILSAVPPSLAVPVLILTILGFPINTAAACALIAVSGMTVNASVISAGELWRREMGKTMSVYRLLRGRLPALLATTGTTIAGALPFLFLREGNNALVRILALVTVLGVAFSFFCSLTLVPSLMNLYSGIRIRRKHGNHVPHGRDRKTLSGVL